MGIMSWDESYSVNIAMLDEQHKTLFDYLNQLLDLMIRKAEYNEFKSILEKLVFYTQTHFNSEEQYFNLYKYPDAKNHILEHQHFTKKIDQFHKEFEEGNIVLSIEILDFLKDWLMQHIKGTDRQYSNFLNNKGLR